MITQYQAVNLPGERDDVVTYSVSRHDLIRGWIGLGVGMGLEPNRQQIALTVLVDQIREPL